VQRATAQLKTGIFRDYSVAEASPGIQAGWSDNIYFSFSFCLFCQLIWSYCSPDIRLPVTIKPRTS
jgi:hypothetical protein